MRRAVVLLSLLVLLPAAPAAADDVAYGKRIGPVEVGMTKRQIDRKLGERGVRSGITVSYAKWFVVLDGGRATTVTTFARRYDLLGISPGSRAGTARKRLALAGFRFFDCRAGNGTFGMIRKGRTRVDFVPSPSGGAVVQSLTVGRGDLSPTCE